MQFFTGAMEFNDVKFNELMKSLWVTNELDGSEDNLVSEKEKLQIVSLCHCEGDLLDL